MFLKVEGKGSKQRLVPISPKSDPGNKALFLGSKSDQYKKRSWRLSVFKQARYPFITNHDLSSHQRAGRYGGNYQKYQSAHIPPLLCDTLTWRRRQSAGYPMHVGAWVYFDYRNLHPHRPQYVAKWNHRTSSTQHQIPTRKKAVSVNNRGWFGVI